MLPICLQIVVTDVGPFGPTFTQLALMIFIKRQVWCNIYRGRICADLKLLQSDIDSR